MTHLLPHEWDNYGAPPKPGKEYPDPEVWECAEEHKDCHDRGECYDRLVMDADEHYEEGERLRQMMNEQDYIADTLMVRANNLKENHNGLA